MKEKGKEEGQEKRGKKTWKGIRSERRKCVMTEKSGNNFRGEIHETQLRITPHLTVLELSKYFYGKHINIIEY